MEQKYTEQFHKAGREEQRLAAAVRGLDPSVPFTKEEREELLGYLGHRKRSAMELLIRCGDLSGIRAMGERGWIEPRYLQEYREMAAAIREMEIWAYLYPGSKETRQRTGSADFCGRIWTLTLKKLRMKLPGFSGAFGALDFREDGKTEYLAGDGFHVYYRREELQRRFCREPDAVARDYMHLFLHCLLFHPVLSRGKDRELWDLACDMEVEEILDGWEIRELKKPGRDRRRLLRKEAGVPGENASAETIYRVLRRNTPSPGARAELSEAFHRDGHGFWREYRQEDPSREEGPGKAGEENRQREKSLRYFRKWRQLRKEYAGELEKSLQKPGVRGGGGRQAARPGAGSRYDYREFLEHFMVSGEEVETDPDSFDYIPYWYSREHYDGMVMLEPLEYREISKLREMVIAIDTSGSCSGRVARQFLRETYQILSRRENFFRRMQVHLIQCDSMIQEHVVIRSEEEFLDYMERAVVKGLGGTDFRPVFQLVDRLMEQKEVLDLGGLIYFTDGDGIFPAGKPAYDTAFVFLNDEYEKHRIPDWGIRLNLGMEFWEE